MADIELVIKIDEEQYNTIKSDLYNTFPAEMREWGLEAIRNGTPLPKRHGRLVDISPYEQREAFATSWNLTRKIGQIVKDEECVPLSELPTVIEASESEE